MQKDITELSQAKEKAEERADTIRKGLDELVGKLVQEQFMIYKITEKE